MNYPRPLGVDFPAGGMVPKYEVRDWVDIFQVQRSTIAFAASVGFTKRECEELAIVASELTSNILKYGVRGSVELERLSDGGRAGLRLTARDSGPPFRDLEIAMRDGHDDRGPIDPMHLLHRKGIGGGLGAVLRLTHSFRVDTEPSGKQVVVERFLTPVRQRKHI